jgi:hypothetical protein
MTVPPSQREKIGRATITEIGEYHQYVLKNPDAKEKLENLASALRETQATKRR